MPRQTLGKGLEELLKPISTAESDSSTTPPTGDEKFGPKEIPIEKLLPNPDQPRAQFPEESLQELANTIKQVGVVQPILARPIGSDRYQIVAGERRWRAAALCKFATVPAIIRPLDDDKVLLVALVENLQREDLNVVDEADAYFRLHDEFGLTHGEIGSTLGKARSSVTNLIRIRELPPRVRTHLRNGDIELGHAKLLLGLTNDVQILATRGIVKGQLSVRQAEKFIQKFKRQKPTTTEKTLDPNVLTLQNELSEKLGATTNIRMRGRSQEKGEVVIRFSSLDELDGILQHLRR